MDENSPREVLARLVEERGENYGALSRLLGRNAAYIQQFIKRGSPRKLDEGDRRLLARYFGIDEALLGAPIREAAAHVRARNQLKNKDISFIPRLDIEASAGPGSLSQGEWEAGVIGFDNRWLKNRGLSAKDLSIVEVKGESMSPTLNNGDTIMVDRADGTGRLRDGIYVLRLDDALMVKRVALSPHRAGELTVSSDNPHYPRWDNLDRMLVDIVGRVVWCGRVLS